MARKWLSQREVWDDSALRRTWDAAQAEYQQYHSILNGGENIEDILQQIEAEEAKNTTSVESPKMDDMDIKAEHDDPDLAPNDGVHGDQSVGMESDEHQNDAKMTNARSRPIQSPDRATSAFQNISQSTMPAALLGSVQDEALKNLMLSWYYAGYYTGVYETKQNAASSMQEQGEANGDQKASNLSSS